MSNTTTWCSCSITDGQDKCELLGQCVDYCSTPSVINELADANKQVVDCDPFLPNTCGGDLVCQSSSQCWKLACDSAYAKLTTVQCAGLCLPAVRLMVGARFSDAGDAVVVDLNAPAKSGQFPCSAVFDSSSSLGGGAWCDMSDQVLTIKLGQATKLRPGDLLALRQGQKQLMDKLLDGAYFGGNTSVSTCRSCVAPSVSIAGPKVMPWGCFLLRTMHKDNLVPQLATW